MKRIYICHPYSADPHNNAEKVAAICVDIAKQGHLPIAPQIYLPVFVSEETDRALAMCFCLELLSICDEIMVCGANITNGMAIEIDQARRLNVPASTYLRV